MTRSLALLASFALALPMVARAEDFTVDPAHTKAGFSVKHMMVSTVRGGFNVTTGTIHYDPKNVGATTVEATLDAASVNTDNGKRDEHLRSPDFFDVQKFPTITFKSTKVAKAGKDKLKVTGDLTMHGVTKPVVLEVEGPTATVKDPWGNMKAGATATAKLNRKDFGLTWNKGLEAGGVLVGDEVTITLDIELNQMPAETAQTK